MLDRSISVNILHRKRLFRFAAFVFAACALLGSRAYALEPDQIFDKVSASVVLVLALDKTTYNQGSGVVIAPRRVATNCHVVNKRDRLLIKWGEAKLPATLEHVDAVNDLCLLSVPDLGAAAVDTRKLENVRVGQRVYAIGNPEGLELTLTEGLVSGIRTSGGRQLIQTSAPFTHGSSGGGLFDTSGRLIGLTSSGVKNGLGLNFAIPVDYALQASKRAGAVAARTAEKTDGNTAGFPRALSGAEIAAHFARYTQIEANLARNHFTLKIRPGNIVERECYLCRVQYGDGKVTIKTEDGLVCFDWTRVTYPASGCFQLVQTNINSFSVRALDQEVTIMQYSIP